VAAYVIVEIEITDPERFQEYRKAVPATIEHFGGRYLLRGSKVEAMEGDWTPGAFVVLEFPTLDKARAWWSSEEYRPLKALRRLSSEARIILADEIRR
jgi:uncharacterized protein (DUF1330 family)